MSQRLIFLAMFFSFSALASANQQQKAIGMLESLKKTLPTLNVEAYERELNYQQMDMPSDQRAKIEANRMASEITAQIHTMYANAFARTGDADIAAEEMKASIELDLNLIAPEMQDDIRELSLRALESAQRGGSVSAELSLPKLESRMKEASLQRSEFLNLEMFSNVQSIKSNPFEVKESDADKREYKSKKEIVTSLVSNKNSTGWTDSAGTNIDSGISTSNDGQISFQFKTSFLGVAVEAGPVIRIKKQISTSARVVAEGLNPLLTSDGNIDFSLRDHNARPIVKNGKLKKRFAAFFCDASLMFETNYTGSGGFTYMGIGGSVSRNRTVSDRVNMESRRVLVPEYVDGKSVTMPLLRQICHVDFLNAKINNRMTIKQSMEVTMKNMLAGAIFIHSKTKCATDSHCIGWFKKQKINQVGNTAYPRCVEESREKYRACTVASLRGQNCPVYENKKLVSSGSKENICDRGLKCVVTKKAGPLWLQYAVGKCMPKDAKTYKAPRVIR